MVLSRALSCLSCEHAPLAEENLYTYVPAFLPALNTNGVDGHILNEHPILTHQRKKTTTVLARGRLQEMAIGLVQGRLLDILNSVNDCIDHVPPVGTEYEFEVSVGKWFCDCGFDILRFHLAIFHAQKFSSLSAVSRLCVFGFGGMICRRSILLVIYIGASAFVFSVHLSCLSDGEATSQDWFTIFVL